MAALSITPANVVPSASAVIAFGVAGETITAGKALYADLTGVLLGGVSDASAATATVLGIAVASAAIGQPIPYAVSDPALVIGATVSPSAFYILGNTASGAIAPVADLASGFWGTLIGVGVSTTAISCDFSPPVFSRSATAKP